MNSSMSERLKTPEMRRVILVGSQVIPVRAGEIELEVLLGHRNTSSFRDQWAFFGGMREKGEALIDTARREAWEELGIVIKRSDLLHVKDSASVLSEIHGGKIHSREINIRSFLLDATGLNPVNAAPNEHDRIAWMGLSEALNMHEKALAAYPDISRMDRDKIPGALAPRTADTIKSFIGPLNQDVRQFLRSA